jgi:hypothetical protein
MKNMEVKILNCGQCIFGADYYGKVFCVRKKQFVDPKSSCDEMQ